MNGRGGRSGGKGRGHDMGAKGRGRDMGGRGLGHGGWGQGRAEHDAEASTSVTSSNQPATRGMNRGTQPSKDPSKRVVLRIVGDIFMENTAVRTAMAIFKGHFDGPWIYWKEVPPRVKEGCWKKFLERFQPERPALLSKMRQVWELAMKGRYSDTMNEARTDSMRLGNKESIMECADYPPIWICREDWKEMVRRWSTPSWQKRSEIASQNRQAHGFVNHSGGPVPTPVWGERMAEEMGRQPSFINVYDRTHKRKGTDEYIDERAETASGNYSSAMSQKYGDDASAHPNIDGPVWITASGGIKKGRVLGISSKDPAIHVLRSSASTSASQYSRVAATDEEHISRYTAGEMEHAVLQTEERMRQEMHQALEQVEKRHQDQMRHQLERAEQRHQKQMQALATGLLSRLGLPSATFELPHHEDDDDDDDASFS